jgi:transcriptional regulator with XRE-family HTH domain
MTSSNSPTVQRRRLGQLLRQFRTGKNLTTRQAGAHLERSESWVSRVESGESGIRLGELRALMDVYGVTEEAARTEMEELARGGRQRGWWSQYRSALSAEYAAYIGFEESASRLLVYESLVVHGLLQTENYARAVIRASSPTATEETIERRVQVRLKRQELLAREPAPLEMWVVLDEAVLRRVIGGDIDAHLAQLGRLLHVARMPTIRIQVIPFRDASNPGATSGFTILEYPGGADRIAYIEGLTSDVYEEGDAAERLTLGHENLRAAALSETSTIALIKRVRDEVAR